MALMLCWMDGNMGMIEKIPDCDCVLKKLHYSH